MKKYIAFCNSHNSGIVTKEKAIEWANSMLSKHANQMIVYVAEVMSVVERETMPVKVKDFFCQTDEPALKDKAA